MAARDLVLWVLRAHEAVREGRSRAFGWARGAGLIPDKERMMNIVTGTIAHQAWFFRVRGNNALGSGDWSTPVQVAARHD